MAPRFHLDEKVCTPVPLSRKNRKGQERSWKADILKDLQIELWVLQKQGSSAGPATG